MAEQQSDTMGTDIYCQICIVPLVTSERVYYTPEFVLTKEDASPVGCIELDPKKGINIRLAGQEATPLHERYLYDNYQDVEREAPSISSMIFHHIQDAITLLR